LSSRNPSTADELAIYLASANGTIKDFAKSRNLALRTVYRWSASSEVRAKSSEYQSSEYRRRITDQAVEILAHRSAGEGPHVIPMASGVGPSVHPDRAA
jgi:hypothetical protein